MSDAMPTLRWSASRLPRRLAGACRAMATAPDNEQFAAAALALVARAVDELFEWSAAWYAVRATDDDTLGALLAQARQSQDPSARWRAAVALAAGDGEAAAASPGAASRPPFATTAAWLNGSDPESVAFREAVEAWLLRLQSHFSRRAQWGDSAAELVQSDAVAGIRRIAGELARGGGALRLRLIDVWPTNEGSALVARPLHGYRRDRVPVSLHATGPLLPPGETVWVDRETGHILTPRGRTDEDAASTLAAALAPESLALVREHVEELQGWLARVDWLADRATQTDRGALRLEWTARPQEHGSWHGAWWSRAAGNDRGEGSALVLPHRAEWQSDGVAVCIDIPNDITMSERRERGVPQQARAVATWLRDALAAAAELGTGELPGGDQILAGGDDALVCPLLGPPSEMRHAGAWAARWLREMSIPEAALDGLLEDLGRASEIEEAYRRLERGRARLASHVGGTAPEVVDWMSELQARLDPNPPSPTGDEDAVPADVLAASAYDRWAPDERADWMAAAAAAFEEADRSDDAAAAWDVVLDANPNHLLAASRVEQRARRGGNLALSLELLLERADNPALALADRVEAWIDAAVIATELDRPRQALELADQLASVGMPTVRDEQESGPDKTADQTARQNALDAATRLATRHAAWDRAARWAEASADDALRAETAEHLLGAAGAASGHEARKWAARAVVLWPELGDRTETYRALRPPAAVVESAVPQTPEQRRARLERQLEEAADHSTRGSVLAILVEQAEKLGLTEADRSLYQAELLKHRPHDPELLEAVQHMRAAEGNWREVDRLLERRARLADRAEQKRALGLERARVLRQRLGRNERALVLLNELIQDHPKDAELLEALEDVSRALSRWESLLKAQLARAELVEGPAKAELLVEAAGVAHHQMDSEARARSLYAEALALQPDHPTAARELGAMLQQAGEYEQALPWLEVWARSVHAAAEPQEALAAQLARAESAEAMKLYETALEAYEAVLAIDPTHVDALLAAAKLHREVGHPSQAEKTLRRLLALGEDVLDDRAKAFAESQLSELSLASGSLEESRAHLLAAHRAEPNDLDVMRRLVDVSDQMRRWADAVGYRLQLAERSEDAETQYLLLSEAGDLARREMNDIEMAMSAYERAHLARPDARAPLGVLVELYLGHGRYVDAAQVLARLTDIEADPKKKSQNALAVALLYRDHLGDHAQAAVYLERALEYDPMRLEAFEALDQVLAGQERYEGERAQAYERMIQRLDGVDDSEHVIVRLLLNLARLSATAGNVVQSEGALRRAIGLRPRDPELRAHLGELYANQEGTADKAVETLRMALDLGSRDPSVFRQLRRVYTRRRNTDGAWCTCGVLVHLNKADEKERTYYDAHRTGALKVTRTLRDHDLWRQHLYPDASVEPLGTLFETLYQSMPQLFRPMEQSQPRIRAVTRIDLHERSTFSGFATAVPRILGVSPPRFFRAQQQVGVHKHSDPEPVLWVSPELADHGRGKPLRFALGRGVALFHEPLWVYDLLPPAELQRVLEAIYALVTGSVTPEQIHDSPWLAQLDAAVPSSSRPALQTLAAPHFRGGAVPDVLQWGKWAQQTANRVGLLLCNDVEVAVAGIHADPCPQSGLSEDDQVWDLLRYAASERYHALRAHLGIAVQ